MITEQNGEKYESKKYGIPNIGGYYFSDEVGHIVECVDRKSTPKLIFDKIQREVQCEVTAGEWARNNTGILVYFDGVMKFAPHWNYSAFDIDKFYMVLTDRDSVPYFKPLKGVKYD